VIPQSGSVFDEMGIPAADEGLALRERLQALLDAPSGHVLLLGEDGTGKSLGLELFSSRAVERGHSVVQRHGRMWRFSRDGGERLSRELWPLLVDLKAEQVSIVVDDADDLDMRSQTQLLEALRIDRSGLALYIVAAAHSALPRLASAGGYSEALWKVFDVERIVLLPPLRHDPSQIPQLVKRIVRQIARRFDIEPPPRVHPKAVGHLQAYPWPGNVRQLLQVLERAVLGCSDGELTVGHLPAWLLDGDEYGLMRAARASMSLEDLERCYIEIVLKMVNGHRCKAAAILGINRKTLAMKILRHGIQLAPGAAQRRRSSRPGA
jgi:transcriptional regulator with PAS, ATPase and Fis domain